MSSRKFAQHTHETGEEVEIRYKTEDRGYYADKDDSDYFFAEVHGVKLKSSDIKELRKLIDEKIEEKQVLDWKPHILKDEDYGGQIELKPVVVAEKINGDLVFRSYDWRSGWGDNEEGWYEGREMSPRNKHELLPWDEAYFKAWEKLQSWIRKIDSALDNIPRILKEIWEKPQVEQQVDKIHEIIDQFAEEAKEAIKEGEV